jgi:STE24 endopeptidase
VPPFAAALSCVTLLWLALAIYVSRRQSAHVAAKRDRLPSDFATEVTLDEHRKAADYTIARERVARVDMVLDAAITLGWLFGGVGLLYGALSSLIPPSLGLSLAFLVAAVALRSLLGLPLEVYRTFHVERRFGFNRTDARTFVADRLKGAVIGLVVMVPLLATLLWVMRTLTGLWWLYAWLGLVVLMVLAPSVYVRFVAPRFNRFEPLGDVALRERIEALLVRSGFRSSGLFLMDASRRSTHGNAYFIGFGRAKRIVLFDTLVTASTPEEIEAVVAHELGHFRHGHVITGLVRGALMLLAMLAAVGWLSRQPWLLPSFGLHMQNDGVALFVCMMILGAASPLLAPLSNWISRKNEYEADDYARRQVGAAPMAAALIRLARDNASTLTPDPLYAFVHHSHPSVPLRLRNLRANGPS